MKCLQLLQSATQYTRSESQPQSKLARARDQALAPSFCFASAKHAQTTWFGVRLSPGRQMVSLLLSNTSRLANSRARSLLDRSPAGCLQRRRRAGGLISRTGSAVLCFCTVSAAAPVARGSRKHGDAQLEGREELHGGSEALRGAAWTGWSHQTSLRCRAALYECTRRPAGLERAVGEREVNWVEDGWARGETTEATD